jgi:excinuclease Cho
MEFSKHDRHRLSSALHSQALESIFWTLICKTRGYGFQWFFKIKFSVSMNPASLTLSHHIDPAVIAQLPHAPGVYIFRGDTALPLYIGKSLDIRGRVLTHLRGDEKSRMVAQARHVDYIETAGDISAQLLEAQLIKQHKPLYNIRLRRIQKLFSIRLVGKDKTLLPHIVSSRDVTLGETEGLFGLFRSPKAVQAKLYELAESHQLCHGLLGLEKIGKRGCFRFQIRKCLGACVGQEDSQHHDQRLMAGLAELKIHIWPYDGAIDLVEQRGDWIQRHRIEQWRYLGTWCSRDTLFKPSQEQGFDLDTYKILVKPILLNADAVRIEQAAPV